MRERLHAGAPFDTLLGDAGLELDLSILVPFARWRPEPTEEHGLSRIFDARFYLATLPAEAPAPTVDHSENVRLVWTSAADLLAAADAGRATIIYPTRRNLERLARFADFDAAVADAARHPCAGHHPASRAARRPRLALHSRRCRLSDLRRARRGGGARLMRALRRIAGVVILGGLLLSLAFLLWAALRGRPQDLPWTPLDSGRRSGCSPVAS